MAVQPPVAPVLARMQSIAARFDLAPARSSAGSAPVDTDFSALLSETIGMDDVSLEAAGPDSVASSTASGEAPLSVEAQMALHRAGMCTCDRNAGLEAGGGAVGEVQASLPQNGVPAGSVESGAAPVSSTSVMGLSSRPGWSGAAPYESAFTAAGLKHGVDPRLLASVARAESNFRPAAKSSAGAVGLMQFMPATARSMGIDPLDPNQAIDGAARYLRQQMDRFGSVDLAVAAYNAGPGAVSRFGGIPPYSETRNYVTKVLGSFRGLA